MALHRGSEQGFRVDTCLPGSEPGVVEHVRVRLNAVRVDQLAGTRGEVRDRAMERPRGSVGVR